MRTRIVLLLLVFVFSKGFSEESSRCSSESWADAMSVECLLEKRNLSSLPPLPLSKYLEDFYLNHSVGLKSGAPTEQQNLEINTKEIYFQTQFPRYHVGLLIPAFEIGIAQLNAGNEHGYNYSMGPAMMIPISGLKNKLRLIGHGKIHWLTRHTFTTEDGSKTKRYGGPVQWSYGFGARYQMQKNTFSEYTWQHLSNGDRYDTNPVLETHNFSIGVNF